ncbi:MAG: NINE protein [Clostridiales bacterium]|jgi:TM2 domain-containing membrane protein YozV|nr:NINE protein [Clostridiales bacterium]
MAQNNCPQCGAPIAIGAVECKYCGEAINTLNTQQPNLQQTNIPQPNMPQQPVYQQPVYPQQGYQQQGYPYRQTSYPPPVPPNAPPPPVYNQYNTFANGINPSWPIKSKVVAGVLGILLGGLGIHKFYLGKVGMGILYLLFCWTYIPAIVGFIEGIIYLASNDHNFQVKNRVRIR